MIVYGRQAVREALRGRRRVAEVWATQTAAREPWLREREIVAVDGAELTRLCGNESHQGVSARVGDYPYVSADALLEAPEPLIVALDEVQDPNNLGAICRTAEAVGATGVVVGERRAAHVTAAVCKASAGAVEHLAIARVRNLTDFLGAAKKAGCWCYGASADADTGYTSPDYRGGVVLVLGGEGRGLRPRVRTACDDLLALPMAGQTPSLNVSATAAVLLYAVLRARRAP